MRLSLSQKLYATTIALLLIFIAINLFQYVSLQSLNLELQEVDSASRRVNAMQRIAQLATERELLLKNIILSGNDAEIRHIIDVQLPEIQRQFTQLLAEYGEYAHSLHRATAGEIQTGAARVRELWADFQEAGDRVALLGAQNSNSKAAAVARELEGFWPEIMDEMESFAQGLLRDDDPEMAELANRVRVAIGQVTLFRARQNRFVNETEPSDIAFLDGLQRQLVENTDEDILETIRRLPPARATELQAILDRLHTTAMAAYEKIVPLVYARSNAAALELYNSEAAEKSDALGLYLRSRIQLAVDVQDGHIDASNDRTAFLVLAMWVAIVSATILGLGWSWLNISTIDRSLGSVIRGLDANSSSLKHAASQITAAAQSLAQGSTEQAASLEETSSALEEMASMTRQNADNATQTNRSTKENDGHIITGAQDVRDMSLAMSEINESAEKISRIIKTIEDIAFQTNLLALNAAVEAARAGEAGKGFAVVADEVRNLAQRSAQAARDTTELIQGTVERVHNGSEIAKKLANSFERIEEGTRVVSRLISEIATASNEQAQGVEQLNTAVAEMDKVTQQNASMAEESSAAASELSRQALALKRMVTELRRLVKGGEGSGETRSPETPVGLVERTVAMSARQPRPHQGKIGTAQPSKMIPISQSLPLDEDDGF